MNKDKIYQEFLKENPENGILKVQVFMANQAIPIANVNILIEKEISNETLDFYNGMTNESGIIEAKIATINTLIKTLFTNFKADNPIIPRSNHNLNIRHPKAIIMASTKVESGENPKFNNMYDNGKFIRFKPPTMI